MQDRDEVDVIKNEEIGFVEVGHSSSAFKLEIRSTKVQNPNEQTQTVSDFEI
jgi:hypothetical protein